MSKRRIRDLERLIDTDYENLNFWLLERDTAIIAACEYFEKLALSIQFSVLKNKNETFMDFMEALDWLIRNIYKKNPLTKENGSDKQYAWKYIEEAYIKAIIHSKMEQIFKPYTKGLYNADVNDNKITFTYPNEEFGEIEAINAILLDEFNKSIEKKYLKVRETIDKGFKGIDEMLYQTLSIARVEIEFDFPDEYRIGPYTIKDIKNFWRRILRESFYANKDNMKIFRKDESAPLNLVTIDFEKGDWDLKDIGVETAMSLLNDFTYDGVKKGKQQYFTPFFQPLLKLSDGRFLLCPQFVMYNNFSRNAIANLNRIYDSDANIDSETKELVFISKLKESLGRFDNIKIASSISITDTDVDLALYDLRTKSLLLFEIKWFVEPVTAVEIKSKDEEISKAMNEQLPKYRRYIENNCDEFMLKAFEDKYEVKEIGYFVLTRNSIGSGLLSSRNYEVLNLRMLVKNIFDSKGNLSQVIEDIKNRRYLPQINKDFILNSSTTEVNGVKIEADSLTKKSLTFNLDTELDKDVTIGGLKMEPSMFPSREFKKIDDYTYVDVDKKVGLSRRERREKERQLKKQRKKELRKLNRK